MTFRKRLWNAKYCGEMLHEGSNWKLQYIPLLRWGFHIGKPARKIQSGVTWEIHLGPFCFTKWKK